MPFSIYYATPACRPPPAASLTLSMPPADATLSPAACRYLLIYFVIYDLPPHCHAAFR